MIILRKINLLLGGMISISIISTIILFSSTPFTVANEDNNNGTENQLLLTPQNSESAYFEELTLSEIFKQTESGIVSIAVTKSPNLEGSGVGSGFVYDLDGNIITNNHVIENAEKIIVTFIDGRSYNAKIVGSDVYSDLAVIKIDEKELSLTSLKIGDSDFLKVGQKVAAIGNPYGLSGSMTAGIVSQIGRLIPAQGSSFSIPDVIQTDAAINPGNSGGPLLNLKGEVVGVTTAIYSRDGSFSGVGFAIPSNTIHKIIPNLIENGTYKHPWIGITSLDISPDIAELIGLKEAKGILIMNVVKDGPASKAGLRGSTEIIEKNQIKYTVGGDVILAIDDKEVRKIEDILTHLQKEKSVGDKITLKILRDEKIKLIDLILEERP